MLVSLFICTLHFNDFFMKILNHSCSIAFRCLAERGGVGVLMLHSYYSLFNLGSWICREAKGSLCSSHASGWALVMLMDSQ